MSNGILINIGTDLFLKSDKYSFFICVDKGDTKFPGGVISRYYKPMSWHNAISDTEHCIARNNYEISDETINFINKEKEFFKWINESKFEMTKIDIIDHSIEPESTNYVLKEKGKNFCYPSSFKNALKSLYLQIIRNSDFNNFTQIFELINTIKSTIK